MVWSRNMYGDTLQRRHKTIHHRVACEGRDTVLHSNLTDIIEKNAFLARFYHLEFASPKIKNF
jgi:hypothetical protein